MRHSSFFRIMLFICAKNRLRNTFISPILRKHHLKDDTHPSIVLTVFRDESPEHQWYLGAYLKLSRLLDQKFRNLKHIAEENPNLEINKIPSQRLEGEEENKQIIKLLAIT